MKLAYTGIVIAIAFAAGAFISSPELRAYAANTVFSSDIVDGEVKTADLASSAVTTSKLASNSVNGGKVADQSLSAADLGPDSVGASEMKGVTKLIFAQCTLPSTNNVPPGGFAEISCSVPGADSDDFAIAQSNDENVCISVTKASPGTNIVTLYALNECPGTGGLNGTQLGLIVWDT